MEGWQAKLIFQPGRVAAGLFLFRSRGHGVREFLVENDTIMTVTPDKPVSDQDLVFAYLEDEQVKAIQDAILEYGIKRPDAGFTEGKLVATEKHLADMRLLALGSVPAIPVQPADLSLEDA